MWITIDRPEMELEWNGMEWKDGSGTDWKEWTEWMDGWLPERPISPAALAPQAAMRQRHQGLPTVRNTAVPFCRATPLATGRARKRPTRVSKRLHSREELLCAENPGTTYQGVKEH